MVEIYWRLREIVFALARSLFLLGLRATPHLTGKLRPLGARGGTVVLSGGERGEIPPRSFWLGYAATGEDYIAGGRADMEAILALLARHHVPQPRVVLDLGCAAGRMTRHFPRSEGSEIWGADIRAAHIAWCQRNLPELNFVTVSTAPHLPFEDGHFDFAMGASVFTHITDLADAWLLELRRVLKPGGHLYLTLHDKVSARDMQAAPGTTAARLKRLDRRGRLAGADMVFFDNDPASQVFYDRDYISRKWSRWMDLVAYEERFHAYQAAMLLRKRGPEG